MREPVSLWMRCETCADEHRAPISPHDAQRLVRAGFDVTVERSPGRAFAIEDYADAGCAIAPAGGWLEAPREAFIVGLKGLPDGPAALSQRHIFFGHAYKGQAGAERLLARFARGGGALLDLEYLTDSQNQRLVAFGRWAGYVGAALALLHWSARLTPPLRPMSQNGLNAALAALHGGVTPKVLVLGARGRCGRGACEALAVAGIEPTRWDVEETRIVDRDALLAHDLMINTVLVTAPVDPFLTRLDILRASRRLTVIADVTCDVASSCNALPIYDAPTSWDRPARRVRADPRPLDVIAIDNLPSLLPRESSSDFSASLTPLLLELDSFTAPWQRCMRVYHEKSAAVRHHARRDMLDVTQRTGSVHWVGAGLSNGSGLRFVAKQADRMVLWNRNPGRAEELARRLKLPATVETCPFTPSALAGALSAGDIVVSMLPATEHPALLEVCIERGAHFACSSYVSDAIRDLAPIAARAGLVVLAESGLDPGLDHLLAQELVARAQAAIGGRRACISFASYCGGIPAIPNEFRYRFSWAPLGVLLALRSPARFVEGFEQRVAARPCEETRRFALDAEDFEVYANRDSVPFIRQYNIPDQWRVRDFVRGTLRHAGWSNAWRDIFAAVRTCDDAQLAMLARDLAARHPTTDDDRDRVVLAIELRVVDDDGDVWAATARVDAVGDRQESAMARYVSLPLACGVIEMLEGRMTSGLNRAAEGPEARRRWLEHLDLWGLRFAIEENSQVGMEV